MADGKKLTRIFVLGMVALVTLYDVIIYAASGTDATISRLLLRWASDLPILMLPIGILLGHWFWPQPRPERKLPLDPS